MAEGHLAIARRRGTQSAQLTRENRDGPYFGGAAPDRSRRTRPQSQRAPPASLLKDYRDTVPRELLPS